MSELNVREATPRDLEPLAALFDAYRVFYEQQSDLEGARQFLRERFEKQDSAVLVAARDDRLLGFTQLYPIFTSVGMRRVWLLNDLFVSPSARRQGVAQALMNAARAHAESTQAAGLVLETGVSNREAQALYEKLGWRKNEAAFYYQLAL